MPHDCPSLLTDLIEETRKRGATAADGVLYESVNMSVARRMGKPEKIERAESKTLGLRVWVGESQAVVSSDDLSKKTLNDIAARAIAMAKIAQRQTQVKR